MSEEGIGHINSRIDKIEVTLTHAVDAIEKMAGMIANATRTDWGVLASWVGVFLAIGAAAYIPINDDTAELKAEVKTLRQELIDIRANRWTAANQTEFESQVRDEIHRLEDRIWREHVEQKHE